MATIQISSKTLGLVTVIVLVGIIGFLAYQLYFPKTGYTVYTSENVKINPLNVFEGKITNVKVSPGRIEGVSAYDRNCVGEPITECDGGIRTNEYGLLNFHYSHDMAAQPCIHMFGPERLIVEILDSDGNAKVLRTQDFSGMMH